LALTSRIAPTTRSRTEPLPLVDLAAVDAELGGEMEAAISRVCRTQRFIGGEEVRAFEEEFASYLGARHAVGVANGTDALELALRAAGIGAGDEVLVPANTFFATAEAVVRAGAECRFVDVEASSGLIDVASCAERLSPATRAIVPVHLYGRVADMPAVASFAAEHDLIIVEDAAQAHGATLDGRRAGTFGAAGCFSFYPGKNLGALGDAGAVVTDDDEFAAWVRTLLDHGRGGGDDHVVAGVNSRLDALQAAVLRVKLPHLDRWTAARRGAASLYRDRLDDSILDGDSGDGEEREVHHLFPILVENRDSLADHLRSVGIATGVHYRRTVPATTAFRASRDHCPVAEERSGLQLSLPMHPYLSAEDVERVCAELERVS